MSTLYQNLGWQLMSLQFAKRNRAAHKGDFGHVLVIGGDRGMGGAVRMCAEAALRVGAGLVSVATHPEHVTLVSASRPEIMCHGIEKSDELEPLLEKATVIVIGTGLGKSKWSSQLFHAAINSSQPKIVDADALHFLGKSSLKQNNWILTPHPGEAARLLGCTIEEVQADRAGSAKRMAAQFGGVAVLKGAGTVVHAENETQFVCSAGNPGMATAGMGDVLSGVLAGLVAQKFALIAAAKTGVMLHAMAGDNAAKTLGERGLLAMDLMSHLRKLVNP